MKIQIFLLSTAQALRAAVTALIPISLITLFGWASAGSDSGNTGDALRGAGMIWLASHHIPFALQLQSSNVIGEFSFLPIGLLVIPYLTLHGAGLRIARELKGEKVPTLLAASISFAVSYSLIALGLAFLVRTKDVAPHLVITGFFAVAAALLFGTPRILRVNWAQSVRRIMATMRMALSTLALLSLVLLVASLIVNRAEIANIFVVLRLGLISGAFAVLISLLYLPNIAVWSLAYMSGAGFGFGADSLVSPWTTSIGSVPAFPVFAAIPAQAPHLARYLPIIVILVFVRVGFRRIHVLEYRQSFLPAAKVAAATTLLALVLSFMSGGSMNGGNLATVGPSLWKFPLVLGVEALTGIASGAMVRVLVDRIRPRKRLKRVSD